MAFQINRRAHERFRLPSAYTPIAVRTMDEAAYRLEGHAYDISEGGIQFELDQPIAPGTRVAIQIALPGLSTDGGPGRAVFVIANVIWIDEDDLATGPARMAAAFTAFARVGDRERLLAQISTGRYARAA